MAAILGLGLSAHALVDEGERVGVLPDVTDYDDIHKLADALDTPGDGPTIAIVPTWIDEAAFMRLRTAHSLLPERHLAVHRTSLPPLAAAGVAALVSALGTRLAPGVLAAAAPALDGEVRAYAWLGSVRSLTRPKPSFGQRLRSSWPGSAFAASVSPPWVRNAKDPAAVPERLAHPTRLAYAAVGQAERGWVTESLAAALGATSVDEVNSAALSPEWWGTEALVEAVALPVDLDDLARRVGAELDPWPCPWCEALIAATPCAFCGHAIGRPDGDARRAHVGTAA